MRFTKDEISRLEVEFPYKINFIKSKHINIKKNPNYIAYENINDALSNKYNNNPSPIKLAEFMKKNNEIIKPIKVKKFNDEYYLLEGNLRYWASVIAFGEDFEIPSIII